MFINYDDSRNFLLAELVFVDESFDVFSGRAVANLSGRLGLQWVGQRGEGGVDVLVF